MPFSEAGSRLISSRLSLDPSEAFSRTVVRKLAELREAKGLTKERLAKLSGISRSMISMLEGEKRHPTVVTVHALANAMETTVAELIAGLELPRSPRKKS